MNKNSKKNKILIQQLSDSSLDSTSMKSFSPNIKLLLSYLKPYYKRAFIGGFAMFIGVLFVLPTPLITMYIIDHLLPARDFSMLAAVCVLAIGILVIRSFTNYFQNIYFLKFNERVIFDIQLDIFQKVQRFSLTFFHKKQTGYIMSRIRDDANQLRGLLADTGLSVIKDMITFLVGITVIFMINWKLAIATIAVLPFFILSLLYFNSRIRKLSYQYYENNALASRKLQESISGIELFKSFVAEKFDAIKFVNVLKKSVRSNVRRKLMEYLSNIITGFIGGVGPIVVIWYGMYQIMKGDLTLGQLVAFNSFLGYLFGPTSKLMNANVQIQQSLSALTRISEVLNGMERIVEKKGALSIRRLKGDIRFKNVSFSYNGYEPVLKGINIKLREGSSIGIVGESGAGKSTFVRLIPRFYDVNEGEIILDGRNIKNLRIEDLRKQIGIVEQEPLLFVDTIFNNIKLGNRQATKEQIIEAAKKAYIHRVIEALPNGYLTVVGERGVTLSVGEKQRIALARVILRDPRILILDEPTSNLDSKSESLIQKALLSFLKGRTTLIITHRLSLLSLVNKILVLKEGQIIEQGKHEDLYQKNGIYRRLYDQQFLHNKETFKKGNIDSRVGVMNI